MADPLPLLEDREVARGGERLIGSWQPPPPPPPTVRAGKLRTLLHHYVCGGGGGDYSSRDCSSQDYSNSSNREGCSCTYAYWPSFTVHQLHCAVPVQCPQSVVAACPCLSYCLQPAAPSVSDAPVERPVRRHRRQQQQQQFMAPVGDSESLRHLVERYDNEEDADNNNRLGSSSFSPLNNAKFNVATTATTSSSCNTAKQEYITANNLFYHQTGSQSHLAAQSPSSVRAGSERPAAAMFSSLLMTGGTAGRARSTGPVLQRKNVQQIYESSYESIDNQSGGSSGSKNNSRWSPAAEPLPPPRSTPALRQLDLAVKGMEQMWARSADTNNSRKWSVKDVEKEEEQRQQRIQYDSITVLPASLGLPPPPPPPLPRTRSFRQVGGGGQSAAATKGTFADLRASSAPPVSPLVSRKAGQSYR
jgi:hypothetical protein